MDASKETGLFWRKVKNAYRPVCDAPILTDAFFTRKWAARGKKYRLLVEPLDIADWYYSGKNAFGFGHYTDDIDNELTDNNIKRPGRYLLLQQIEQQVFGSDAGYKIESSLAKDKLFQKMLGSKHWRQYVPAEDE